MSREDNSEQALSLPNINMSCPCDPTFAKKRNGRVNKHTQTKTHRLEVGGRLSCDHQHSGAALNFVVGSRHPSIVSGPQPPKTDETR